MIAGTAGGHQGRGPVVHRRVQRPRFLLAAAFRGEAVEKKSEDEMLRAKSKVRC